MKRDKLVFVDLKVVMVDHSLSHAHDLLRDVLKNWKSMDDKEKLMLLSEVETALRYALKDLHL